MWFPITDCWVAPPKKKNTYKIVLDHTKAKSNHVKYHGFTQEPRFNRIHRLYKPLQNPENQVFNMVLK